MSSSQCIRRTCQSGVSICSSSEASSDEDTRQTTVSTGIKRSFSSRLSNASDTNNAIVSQDSRNQSKAAPALTTAVKHATFSKDFTIYARDETGNPVEASVIDPDVKTKPPCRIMATIGFKNITIECINDLRLMSDGRVDYRIQFQATLLTKAELQYLESCTHYHVLQKATRTINMPGVEDLEGDSMRYLVRLQNEWITYIDLVNYYPKAVSLTDQALEDWIDNFAALKWGEIACFNETRTAWCPFANLEMSQTDKSS